MRGTSLTLIFICLLSVMVFSSEKPAEAGSISGMVIEENTGLPLSTLDMNLYDSNWNYVPIDATADSGYYTFYEVPAGTYYVKANPKYPHHFLAEYWDNSLTREDATPISLAEGDAVTGINFALSPGYYIIGKIVDMDTQPLINIDINVYTLDWAKVDVDAESDEYGRYAIGGLEDGSYYVMANPIYAQPYVDQYWENSNGPINATPITVTAPEDLLGINFQLYAGTYIEGYVKDAATQLPVSGIKMKAYNSQGSKMRIDARVRDDGFYYLGAYRSGDYFVRADPTYPQGYMDQYYPGVFSFEQAQTVSITAPKPTTNIDFLLPAGSYIRGAITEMAANPLEDIKVKFYDTDWQLYDLAVTMTKSDGTYLSGALKPGEYYIKAVPIYPQPYIDEYYDDVTEENLAQPVTVSLQYETTGIDFELERGGYLLGTVRDELSGNPIYDMDLDLYDDQWNWVDYSDHTDSRGEFLIGALPFGSYYLNCDPTSTQGYIPEFFNDAFWPGDATLILLSETRDVEDLDFDLKPGGFISGRVTDTDTNNPVDDIVIEVYATDWSLLPLHEAVSRSDGTYTAHGIPTGSYYVKASPPAGSYYSEEYYFNSPSASGAVPVAVTEGSTTSGIDFTLKQTNKPTPTPPVELGVLLDLPQSMFYPGDSFYLNAMVCNPGTPLGQLPLFVALDVYGQIFFWPSWVVYDPPEHTDLDYSFIDVITGVQAIPILPLFDWPDIQGPDVTGLYFYGALLNSEFSDVVGNMAIVQFGYGSH
ncbi:carboxypeptidase regulatory-like domain-containing protein [bacterium]|nr:carboxypeptidase regulatory-like domain-containing protein [candidate division CSSED10-310 bacterium]